MPSFLVIAHPSIAVQPAGTVIAIGISLFRNTYAPGSSWPGPLGIGRGVGVPLGAAVAVGAGVGDVPTPFGEPRLTQASPTATTADAAIAMRAMLVMSDAFHGPITTR